MKWKTRSKLLIVAQEIEDLNKKVKEWFDSEFPESMQCHALSERLSARIFALKELVEKLSKEEQVKL